MPRAAAVRGKFSDKHPVYGRTHGATQRPSVMQPSLTDESSPLTGEGVHPLHRGGVSELVAPHLQRHIIEAGFTAMQYASATQLVDTDQLLSAFQLTWRILFPLHSLAEQKTSQLPV